MKKICYRFPASGGTLFFSLQLKPYIEGTDNENARFACFYVVPIHLSIMTYISD